MPSKDPAKRREATRKWRRKPGVAERQREVTRAWRRRNPERAKELAQKYRKGIRAKVLAHYGNKCACCGETEPLFLTIDHVYDDGGKHRAEIGAGGKIYNWLLDHNFPEGFQVLCYNCNCGRYRNGGICPHLGHVGRYACQSKHRGSYNPLLQRNGSSSDEDNIAVAQLPLRL